MAFRDFQLGVCCPHVWEQSFDRFLGFTGLYVCPPCGATCRRDDEGRIVEYTRPAPEPMAMPEREAA